MPRVASNHKQKNKKFKGTKKAKKTSSNGKVKTKGIAKIKNAHKPSKVQRIKDHKQQQEREIEKITSVN